MANTTTIEISAEIAESVNRQVGTAEFQSVDEVIGAGIKLLNDSNEKLNSLRAALIAGEESGESEAFDVETFIAAQSSR